MLKTLGFMNSTAAPVSMTHMQRYMEAAGMVFDAAVATPFCTSGYHRLFRESEVDRELGKTVKRGGQPS